MTMSPVASESSDCSTCSAKLTRYWRSFITPIRRWSNATRSVFTLVPHRCVAPDRVTPDEREDADAHDGPEHLHREPAQELGIREVTDERLDREIEGPAERQEPRDGLHPLREERERDEPAGEQQLERDVELEQRS